MPRSKMPVDIAASRNGKAAASSAAGGMSIRPTGIDELDRILHGGLPSNAAVLLSGPAGVGKTNLAMQWLFAGCERYEESGVYLTLTEPTTKLLRNVRKMSFFNQEYVASSDMHVEDFYRTHAARSGIHFVDLRQVMVDLKINDKEFTGADIRRLCETIFDLAGQAEAKRLVFDSVTAMAYRLQEKDLIRRFIFELGTYFGHFDANVIMTGEADNGMISMFGIEEFISDGVIKMSYQRGDKEMVRRLEVIKMRGMDFDSRPTVYRISRDGVILFPPLSRDLVYPVSDRRLSTGVPGFDEMTGGGYLEGSAIMAAGPSGVGKTNAAMQFLVAGLRQGEKCLFISFEETREQLIKYAESFDWGLERFELDGLLKIIVTDPESLYIDEHIASIATAAGSFAPHRVVIDSFSAVANVFSSDVLREFSSRLLSHLKKSGITTLFTMASEGLLGSTTASDAHLSAGVDSIILFRYIEIQSELRRAVLIMKMRGSAHDHKLREIIVSGDGLSVTTDFSGYEGLLTGSSRKVTESMADQLHALFLEILGPMGEKIFAEEKSKGLTLAGVRKLAEGLGNQGIISITRKKDFIGRSEGIFGLKGKS